MANRKQDINDFNARIKRINNPRNKSYYDPDLNMHVPKRVPRDKIKKGDVAEEPTFLTLFIVSGVLGAFGFLLAQVLRVRVFGDVTDLTMILALELLFALWMIALLTAFAAKRSVFDRLSQVAGVGAMLVAGHNLIWRWPDHMAWLYTQEYVDSVLASTTEMSVIVGATVYSF